MTYRSDTQPLCRACGKPIAKRTDYVTVRAANSTMTGGFGRIVAGPLYNKDECQRLVNSGRVVHVSYWPPSEPGGRRTVEHFTTWDGESYRDQFFCSGPCREALAYAAARGGLVLQAYNDAIRKTLQGRTKHNEN